MTDKGGPRRGRQLNPYEVAAIKEKLGHETLDSMYPYTHKAKSSEEPPISTPLPSVGSHTNVLETPPHRGRARETSKPLSSHQQRRQQSRETPEPRDKRSPDVPAPDLKKLKREVESAIDTDMPDFGAPPARGEPGQGSVLDGACASEFRNSDGSTPLPAVRNSVLNLDASCAPNLAASVNSDSASRPAHAPLITKREPVREPVPNPTTTFDLTIDDDDADLEGNGDDCTTKDSQNSDRPPPALTSDELDSANAERPPLRMHPHSPLLVSVCTHCPVRPLHGSGIFTLVSWAFIIRLICPGLKWLTLELNFSNKGLGSHVLRVCRMTIPNSSSWPRSRSLSLRIGLKSWIRFKDLKSALLNLKPPGDPLLLPAPFGVVTSPLAPPEAVWVAGMIPAVILISL